jgi:hypothetical protein
VTGLARRKESTAYLWEMSMKALGNDALMAAQLTQAPVTSSAQALPRNFFWGVFGALQLSVIVAGVVIAAIVAQH